LAFFANHSAGEKRVYAEFFKIKEKSWTRAVAEGYSLKGEKIL
jgi:hypothetical protein